jgi:hypothetical protein
MEDIDNLIVGSWTSGDKTITFKENGDLFVDKGSVAGNKFYYRVKHNDNLCRWQLIAPHLGFHTAFIKSINGSELVVDNVERSDGELTIDPKTGDFISGYNRVRLHRIS